MPVDRALPAAHDPRSRFSLVRRHRRAGWSRQHLLPAYAASPLDASAQSSQGSGSDSGRGVPQDRAQAAAWYRKAAEQGDAKAQFNLGLMYRYGPGYSPGLERWVEAFDPAPGHAAPDGARQPGSQVQPRLRDSQGLHRSAQVDESRRCSGDG